MIIKSSTTLRNDYACISKVAHETSKPIYITNNGESDLVVISIEAFERREALLNLKEILLLAEEERLSDVSTVSLSEAENRLREKLNGKFSS